MTLEQRKRLVARRAARKLNESHRSIASKKVVRITMTELKKIIREEAHRARVLKEQGRPTELPEPLNAGVGRGRPSLAVGNSYDEDEFKTYIEAGLRGGRGRHSEFDLDDGENLLTISDQQILDSWDVDAPHYDIYSKNGEILASVPLDLDML